MSTCCESLFLGTWLSHYLVESESENWPRKLGRDGDFDGAAAVHFLSISPWYCLICRLRSTFSGPVGLFLGGPLVYQPCLKFSMGQVPWVPCQPCC